MNLGRDPRRVLPDDPEYLRAAKSEAAFWGEHLGAESWQRNPISEAYVNERFTGDRTLPWHSAIARYGYFRRGLMLGAAAVELEAEILHGNPDLHLTFVDLSAGALCRREETLAARFPGRVAVQVGDLNFCDFPAAAYDLVVTSGTLHHVMNLEDLGARINHTLTPDGYCFVYDYVGESRYAFSAEKRRVFELLRSRELARQGVACPPCEWRDTSDLSPFCGVRSEDILDALDSELRRVELHTASALLIPLLRVRSPLPDPPPPPSGWRGLARAARRRIPIAALRPRPDVVEVDHRFLDELFLASDLLTDAGVLKPGLAFAVYRKRTGGAS